MHVEDAFQSALLGIEIEGACKQDGTPSPDHPVPIQVVENPAFKVTGRNLLDFSFPAYRASYSYDIAHIASSRKEAKLPFTTESKSNDGFGFVLRLKPGTYTLRAFSAPAKAVVNIAMYAEESKIYSHANAISHVRGSALTAPVSLTVQEGAEYVVVCFAADWGDGHTKVTYPADFKAVVERGGTASDYVPYTSQSQSFTLPAEHPYLAKLPNGTADEITVDRAGNVELVARVGVNKNVRTLTDDFVQGQYYSLQVGFKPFASPNEDYFAPVICSALPSADYTASREGIYRTWTGIYVRDKSGRTKKEIQAEVDRNAPLTVAAIIPETRYPLGKIEVPKAQDSIVNAWTDAEVTPNTGIEYTRDVNIVVANLEAAIASITEG